MTAGGPGGRPISELLQRLRARDWRMTAQRRVVAEVFHGDHVHLTADEVHALARERLPEISLATVYNTLNELVTMGEVLEISTGPGPMRYDPNTQVPHQHLACVTCGTLRDVQPVGEPELKLPPSQRNGFRIDAVDITFRGVCPACQSANGDAAKR